MIAIYIIGVILVAVLCRTLYLIGRVRGFNDCYTQIRRGDIEIK